MRAGFAWTWYPKPPKSKTAASRDQHYLSRIPQPCAFRAHSDLAEPLSSFAWFDGKRPRIQAVALALSGRIRLAAAAGGSPRA